MKKLRELKELRGAALTANEDLVRVAETETRNLTEDEVVEFETREEEIEALDKQIKLAEKIESRRATAVAIDTPASTPAEVKEFRFANFMAEAASGRLTGYNAEVDQEARNGEYGSQIQGMGIPFSILSQTEKRDSTAETAGEGGNTFGTDIGPGFIEALRDAVVLRKAGAKFLTGLSANFALPKQTSLPTFGWVDENGNATETNVTWGQVAFAPERLSGTLDLSKQLIVQSSIDIEKMIIGEMVQGVARAFDSAGLNGSGSSHEPQGVAGSTDVALTPIGTNGGVATWDNVVGLETAIRSDNVSGDISYITSSKVAGHLKTQKKDAGSGLFLMEGGTLNGKKVHVSNAVLDNITKGSTSNCSQLFCGDWSQLIMAQWGGLDIVVDPYSKATTGLMPITLSMFADIGVKHGEAFSLTADVDAN